VVFDCPLEPVVEALTNGVCKAKLVFAKDNTVELAPPLKLNYNLHSGSISLTCLAHQGVTLGGSQYRSNPKQKASSIVVRVKILSLPQ
jgi:hypothetical protein